MHFSYIEDVRSKENQKVRSNTFASLIIGNEVPQREDDIQREAFDTFFTTIDIEYTPDLLQLIYVIHLFYFSLVLAY